MTFNEFIHRLHPILGDGSSIYAFTKSMLVSITTEDATEILDNRKEDTYKSYFNGNRSISKFAKELTPYIDPEEFSSYIAQLPSDAVREALCKKFSDVLPDSNPHKIDQEIANLFADVIREEASKTRKAPQREFSEGPHEKTNDGQPTVLDEPNNIMSVIHHQTNVVQNGTNNVNLTNNGKMTLNL